MSARQFRRPWRWRFVLAGIALLLVMLRWSADRDDNWFDPNATVVPSGEYSLTQVRDDGLLVVEVGVKTGETNSVCLKLLGIKVADERKCAVVIRDLVQDVVRLRFDRRRIDEQGRLQAYVFVGDVLLNEELVRQGLALNDTHAADFGPIIRRIERAERAAKEQGNGIWNTTDSHSD